MTYEEEVLSFKNEIETLQSALDAAEAKLERYADMPTLLAENARLRESLRANEMRLKQTQQWRDHYRAMWFGASPPATNPPTDADLEIAIRVTAIPPIAEVKTP